MEQILQRATELIKEGRSFVLVTVLETSPFISVEPGTKAIVHPTGEIEGWLGGPCIVEWLASEAVKCLESGRSRLVFFGPNQRSRSIIAGTEKPQLDTSVHVNYCISSGGAIFLLEPIKPAVVTIAGENELTSKLEQLFNFIGYKVSKITYDQVMNKIQGEYKRLGDIIIVATMNRYDEDAIRFALKNGFRNILLVASRRRWEALRQYLEREGYSPETLNIVKCPAGLDINASNLEEIAVSIVAEVISLIRNIPGETRYNELTHKKWHYDTNVENYRDPVCGMFVTKDTPYVLLHGGMTYYFCCEECMNKFKESMMSDAE
ncbi:MAG: XdhC family protein [Nitrososphaerota archaeon]|nr:XdhC family protein [Candidatus Calditenuis fumarioli]